MGKKRILIIGAGGFIGRNIFEYISSLNKYDIDCPAYPEFDAANETQVFELLSKNKYDVLIHAGVYNPRIETNIVSDEVERNLKLFINFHKYSYLYGKMIYFGSGAEYNKEFDIKCVKEEEKNNGIPNGKYGFYKYVINELIGKSKNIYNFRVFGLFGKYENWSKTFISGACCKAMYDLPITIKQNCYFDYLYINDFVKVIDWGINAELKHHEYNVVSGKRIDLITIANLVNKVTGKSLPIYVCRKGLANEYTASNERLIGEMGDIQSSSMADAIKDLYNYYCSVKDKIDMLPLLYQ